MAKIFAAQVNSLVYTFVLLHSIIMLRERNSLRLLLMEWCSLECGPSMEQS